MIQRAAESDTKEELKITLLPQVAVTGKNPLKGEHCWTLNANTGIELQEETRTWFSVRRQNRPPGGSRESRQDYIAQTMR